MGSVDDWFKSTAEGGALGYGYYADKDVPNSSVIWGFLTATDGNLPKFETGGEFSGQARGVYAHAGLGTNNGNTWGPQENSYSSNSGVMGTSLTFPGVAGTSLNNVGVYGQVENVNVLPAGLLAGVIGTGATQPGVRGWSLQNDGVNGASFGGPGVTGVSNARPGVLGNGSVGVRGTGQFAQGSTDLGNGSGVVGVTGRPGPTAPNFANIAGVVGSSDAQPGVLGTSRAFAGVFGFSNQSIGVTGQTLNPNSFAGYFSGNVNVTGTLTAAVKNAVVAFPDGSHRLLHCMESPEHWFEDFGTGKLRNGRAVVRLDADFAKVVKPAGYHVFLTPKGECRGLSVRRQGGKGFEVRELQGGESNVAFSYRIVGRRKDIKAHRRFARIDTRLPLPTADDLRIRRGLRSTTNAKRRAPRRRKPNAAALRAFVARLEKEARARTPKRVRARRK